MDLCLLFLGNVRFVQYHKGVAVRSEVFIHGELGMGHQHEPCLHLLELVELLLPI